MTRWFGFAIGAAAFAAAHGIEVLMWSAWFGGVYAPWFLNSGRAVAFTLGVLFAAGLVGGLRRLPGPMIAAGAAAAMAGVLVWNGAGTIFPIVLAGGGALILASTMLGAWIGRELLRL